MVDIVCERTIRILQEYVISQKFKLPNGTDQANFITLLVNLELK